METEVKKFDANEAMKSVKEKIKDSFVSLIPDEQWNEMVKKELDEYFKERHEGSNYRNYASMFTKDVHSIISDEVKVKVKEYLSTNFNNVWYNNGIPVCNEKVEEIISKNAGKILADMIGGTVQMALSNAGYQLR